MKNLSLITLFFFCFYARGLTLQEFILKNSTTQLFVIDKENIFNYVKISNTFYGSLYFENCYHPRDKREHPFCRASLLNCSLKTPQELENLLLPPICTVYAESGFLLWEDARKNRHSVFSQKDTSLGQFNIVEFLSMTGPWYRSEKTSIPYRTSAFGVMVSNLDEFKRNTAFALQHLLPRRFFQHYPIYKEKFLGMMKDEIFPPRCIIATMASDKRNPYYIQCPSGLVSIH